MTNRKLARKEALDAIRMFPKGTKEALRDLFESELAEAWTDLETAQDNIAIWRAQGRAMEIRNLLHAIKEG